MKTLKLPLLALVSVLFLWSCSSDDDMGPTTPDPEGLEKGKFGLVINEGGFQQGNSSLGLLDLDTYEYEGDYFSSISSQPLGDIFQSIYLNDDIAYLVVNNSGKIEVLDLSDQSYVGSIDGLTSPRYMVSRGNTAYVSNLFTDDIQIVDLESLNVTGQITTSGWTERMIIDDNFLIVACSNCGYVYRYDLDDNSLVDSIETGAGTNFIHRTSENRIIAFASGAFDGSASPAATLFSNDMELVQRFNLPTDNDFVGTVTFDNATNRLYFADGSIVYYSEVTASSISFQQPLINLGNTSAYGLSTSSDGTVYITDAGDFSGAGNVIIVNTEGETLETIQVGIVPSGVVFY